MHLTLLAKLVFAAACLAPAFSFAEPTIVFVTRHAEKSTEGKDPELTAQGLARARMLATLLRKAGIRHVFSTRTARTEQTAQPLAAQTGLEVQHYEPARHAALIDKVKSLTGPALIVGHSNSVPELVRLLTGKEVPAIADSEYDRLYQVILEKDGSATTLLLSSATGA